MNDKSNIYINSQNKDIANNQKTYYSSQQEFTLDKTIELNKLVVRTKLDQIFEKNKFSNKINVFIKTNEYEKTVSLIAKTSNYLLTLDNEVIQIDKIIKIEEI